MKNILIISLLALAGFVISSCSKDCTDETNIDCPNYNPCHDAVETSASFKMARVVSTISFDYQFTPSDSFVIDQSILFYADDENADYYEWKVGEDERTWNDASFSLEFARRDSLDLYDNPLEVRLITHRTARTDCFPNDDGIDTSYRTLHIIRPTNEILGTWRGSRSDAPNLIYDIKIHVDSNIYVQPNQQWYNYDVLYLDNLYNEYLPCKIRHQLYDNFRGEYRTVFTRQAQYEGLLSCPREDYTSSVTGGLIIEVNTVDNTIYVEWSRRLTGETTVDRVSFTGERI